MSDYLTYAALRTTEIERVIQHCFGVAQKIGIRFEVPTGPSHEAQTWIGVFENGWLFAQADPAVWELIDLFSRVARDDGFDCMAGATEGDFRKWTYEYAEKGQVTHRFSSDPSARYAPSEFPKLVGDAASLARTFNVSRARLSSRLRQFEAPPVQEFLATLGFDIQRASKLRFVVIAPGRFAGPSTLSVVVSKSTVEKAREVAGEDVTGPAGYTTKAYRLVTKASESGYNTVAGLQAVKFAEESDYNDAHDLFIRLRRDGRAEIALGLADKLIERLAKGEWNNLPSPHREIRGASIYGLRGLALYDLGRYDDAIHELLTRALNINRYMGPQHRASIAALLGDALVRQRRFKEALDPLRWCLAERPLHAKTWANLAQAGQQAGQRDEARSACLQGIAADPNLPVWPTVRNALGIRDYDLLPERRTELARTYRHAAQDLMRGGDKLQAVARFRIAHHHAPTDIDCTWGLACALAECIRDGLISADTEGLETVRLLEQVCFGNPSWPWSWGTLIEILLRMDQRPRAMQAAEAYADVHVTKLDDLQNVAIWLTSVDLDMGTNMLRRLLERFVDLRVQGLATGDREQARFKALAMLGWALMEQDQTQDAIQPLTDAAAIDSTNADNLANLAEAHYRLGNAMAASKTLSRGLRVSPQHPRLLELSQRVRGV